MVKLYRLLTTTVTLVAVLVLAWLLLRDDVARARDRAVEVTSDARRQVELGVAGVWLWGHEVYLGPVGTKPSGGGTTRTVVQNVASDRDRSFPTHWYRRPLEHRWAEYQSAPWRPIRTATQYTFLAVGGMVALGTVRMVGLRLFKLPRFLFRPLQIFVFSYFRPRIRASKAHGSARWANRWELLGMRLRHTQPQIVLGRSRIGDWLSLRWVLGIPLTEQFWHLILVAPAGAGKTVKFMITSILRECRPASWRTLWRVPRRRSFVVADLKGELIKKTSRAVRQTHKTLLLAFLAPEISARYNYIAKIKTPLQAWRFAEVWVANTGKGREEFWEDLSRGMIANSSLHLAATKQGANLLDLYELLYPRSPEEIVDILKASPVKAVQDGAKGLMSSMAKNEKLVGAAYADMQRRIRSIGFISQLGETTSADEIDLEAFGQEPTALYIKFDPEYKELLAPYIACFFSQLLEALIAQAERNGSTSLETPVMMYLDEFANIGVLPQMDDRVTTLRSYNIGFFMVVQDLSQLENRYGKTAAQTIFGSAGTKICLGGVNSDDAEEFSRLSGQATVLTSSQGDNREITRLPWASGGSRGTSETGRPLMTPDELRTMGEDVFVISGKRRPILARPKPWYKDRSMRRMVPDLKTCNPMVEDFKRDMAMPHRDLDQVVQEYNAEQKAAEAGVGQPAQKAADDAQVSPVRQRVRRVSSSKPTPVVVRKASGGTPTGNEGPAAVAVGPKPGDPAGSVLTQDEESQVLSLLEKGLTPHKIAMRLRTDVERVRQHVDRHSKATNTAPNGG